MGAFHEEHVHAGRWVAQELLEQRRLTAVRPEVSGVEEALPVGLDEQRVGVEAGVVGEVRGDREWSQRDGSRWRR
jgi:hypothetical protein